MPPRSLVLEELGDALAAVHAPGRVTRIGIDGVDGAGKTRLGEELAQELTSRERPAVRVSLDQFERGKAERYERGELSPEGFTATHSTSSAFASTYSESAALPNS